MKMLLDLVFGIALLIGVTAITLSLVVYSVEDTKARYERLAK